MTDFDSDFGFEIEEYEVEFDFNTVCLDSYCSDNPTQEECNDLSNCEWMSDTEACTPLIPLIVDANMDTANSGLCNDCLLYTSPSPRDRTRSRMPSSA